MLSDSRSLQKPRRSPTTLKLLIWQNFKSAQKLEWPLIAVNTSLVYLDQTWTTKFYIEQNEYEPQFKTFESLIYFLVTQKG